MADREYKMEDEGFAVSIHHYTTALGEVADPYDFCEETECRPLFGDYADVADKVRNAVTKEVEKHAGLDGAFKVVLLGYEVKECKWPCRWAFGSVNWNEEEREWELHRCTENYEGLERTDARYIEILDTILHHVQIQCTEWNQKGVKVAYV